MSDALKTSKLRKVRYATVIRKPEMYGQREIQNQRCLYQIRNGGHNNFIRNNEKGLGEQNQISTDQMFEQETQMRTALEPTQPPMQWVPGALSLGVKWLGREADHSPPSSAEVKNA
jgi:hypothetical protein